MRMDVLGGGRCCLSCFAHQWVRRFIKESSTERGTCCYCGRRNALLLGVAKLTEPFSNLVSHFHRDDDSTDTLTYLIQDQFQVFSDRLAGSDERGAAHLLDDILICGWDDDEGEPPVRGAAYYSTRAPCYHDTQADRWLEYSEWIKAGGHPKTEGGGRGGEEQVHIVNRPPGFEEMFGEDLGRVAVTMPARSVVWRARVGFNEGGGGRRSAYAGAEMGAPPPERARESRAAKEGEVVFYGADQEHTAIAELRPAVGFVLSVGQFVTKRRLSIIDLTRRFPPLDPFGEGSLAWFDEFYDLLYTIGDQMGSPLERDDDKSDYRPCQEAAARIRDGRFDGIRFRSAMHLEGTNLVFFDPTVLQCKDSRLVRVTGVDIRTQDCEAVG